MSVYNYYKGLPPWGKALVVLGAGVSAWVIYSKVAGAIKNNKSLKKSRETIIETNKELNNLSQNNVKPSYSDSQFKIWADAMFACYAGWGTCSNDTIFVSLKNDADVLKLIQAFGVRTIPSGRWNPTPDFTGNLPAVLRDELSASQIQSINSLLKKKGIKYQF